jgi:hypothetical protein
MCANSNQCVTSTTECQTSGQVIITGGRNSSGPEALLSIDANNVNFAVSSGGNRTLEAIAIKYGSIIEFDRNGAVVYVESLADLNYTSTQSIEKTANNVVTRVVTSATLDNGALLIVTNAIYSAADTVQYAGKTVELAGNTNKQTIEIENWPFETASDTLFISLSFNVDGTITSADCAPVDNSTLRTSLTITTPRGNLVSIALQQVALLDDRSRPVTALLNSTDIVIETPSFKNTMVYDPDFSVLLGGGNTGDSGCSGDADLTLFYASLGLIAASFLTIFLFIVSVTIHDRRVKAKKLKRKLAAESAYKSQASYGGYFTQ